MTPLQEGETWGKPGAGPPTEPESPQSRTGGEPARPPVEEPLLILLLGGLLHHVTVIWGGGASPPRAPSILWALKFWGGRKYKREPSRGENWKARPGSSRTTIQTQNLHLYWEPSFYPQKPNTNSTWNRTGPKAAEGVQTRRLKKNHSILFLGFLFQEKKSKTINKDFNLFISIFIESWKIHKTYFLRSKIINNYCKVLLQSEPSQLRPERGFSHNAAVRTLTFI